MNNLTLQGSIMAILACLLLAQTPSITAFIMRAQDKPLYSQLTLEDWKNFNCALHTGKPLTFFAEQAKIKKDEAKYRKRVEKLAAFEKTEKAQSVLCNQLKPMEWIAFQHALCTGMPIKSFTQPVHEQLGKKESAADQAAERAAHAQWLEKMNVEWQNTALQNAEIKKEYLPSDSSGTQFQPNSIAEITGLSNCALALIALYAQEETYSFRGNTLSPQVSIHKDSKYHSFIQALKLLGIDDSLPRRLGKQIIALPTQ